MDDYEWLSDAEQEFWRMLVSAFRVVERDIEATLRTRTGMTFADFTVLIALHETPDGRMHVDGLCERLKWNHPRAALHVGRLERAGVITVEDRGADLEAEYAVALTGVGRHVFAGAAPAYVAAVRGAVLEPLAGQDIAAMRAGLAAVLAHDRAAGGAG